MLPTYQTFRSPVSSSAGVDLQADSDLPFPASGDMIHILKSMTQLEILSRHWRPQFSYAEQLLPHFVRLRTTKEVVKYTAGSMLSQDIDTKKAGTAAEARHALRWCRGVRACPAAQSVMSHD